MSLTIQETEELISVLAPIIEKNFKLQKAKIKIFVKHSKSHVELGRFKRTTMYAITHFEKDHINIYIFYDQIASKKSLITTLIHEYMHVLLDKRMKNRYLSFDNEERVVSRIEKLILDLIKNFRI